MNKKINMANGYHVRKITIVGGDKYEVTYYNSHQVDYLTKRQVATQIRERKP